jgi:hypothetical protein
VRMVDGVHGNTTSLWPRVALHGELMLSTGCLCKIQSANAIRNNPDHPKSKRTQQRLISSSTSSNNTNHSTSTTLDDLLSARWELDTGLSLIRVVADNRNVVARCSAKSATISRFLLDVRNNSSFGDGSKRQDVADRQGSILSSVDELTSVHALICNERLQSELESVGIAELNFCKRSASAGICP